MITKQGKTLIVEFEGNDGKDYKVKVKKLSMGGFKRLMDIVNTSLDITQIIAASESEDLTALVQFIYKNVVEVMEALREVVPEIDPDIMDPDDYLDFVVEFIEVNNVLGFIQKAQGKVGRLLTGKAQNENQ